MAQLLEYHWIWKKQQLRIVYETLGARSQVLLLPGVQTHILPGSLGRHDEY